MKKAKDESILTMYVNVKVCWNNGALQMWEIIIEKKKKHILV